MIRFISQLLDDILDRLLAYLSGRLEHRIKAHELRLQREQAEIDYLEDRLQRLRKADSSELN